MTSPARRAAFGALLVAPALALQGPLRPSAPVDREACAARLAALLEPIVARGAPGVSVAVTLPGGEVVTACAGVADAEAGTPMTARHRMLSGSVGKTYVAAAALGLALEGVLDLDARAASFFPGEAWFEALPNAGDFTVRQLLRHQSGLPRYVFEPAFWEVVVGQPDKVWRREEQLGYVAGRAPLFAAGEGFAYADTNYLVVGLVLERLAAKPFTRLAAERVLAPAGLVDTVPSDSRRIPGLAQGYCRALASLGVPERVLVEGEFVLNPQFEGCGGGYASTPSDLARWARRLYSGRALEAPYLAWMLDAVPADAELGRGVRYGPGVMLRDTPLGELRGHEGIMTGYLAATGWFPAHDVAVAVQLNTDDGRVLGRPFTPLLVDLARCALEAAQPKNR